MKKDTSCWGVVHGRGNEVRRETVVKLHAKERKKREESCPGGGSIQKGKILLGIEAPAELSKHPSLGSAGGGRGTLGELSKEGLGKKKKRRGRK